MMINKENIVQLSQNQKSSLSLMQILEKLMKENRLNVSQLSRNTGLSNTTIKRMCTTPDSNPTVSSLDKLAVFFGIRTTQLMGLEPLMTEESQQYFPNFDRWNKVPLLTLEQSVLWPDFEREIYTSASTKYVKTDLEISDKTFAVVSRDSSLEPRFFEGTIFILEPEKEPRNRDYVLILIGQKKTPQFRQIFVDGPDRYFKPINPDLAKITPFEPIKNNEFKILGVIIQAKTEFF